MTLIAPTLQAFFTDRLTKQLHASPRTIASYRDSLRLLLCFANDRTGIAPSALDWDDLDEPLIAAFLEHLETDRHNSARTRNLRLTAIRALFRYAALRHPEHAAVIARVLEHPRQTVRPTDRDLPHRGGIHRADRCGAREPLGGTARPRDAHARAPRRPPRLRADRGRLRRPRARDRSARPGRRQRAASKERSRSPKTPKRFSPSGSMNELGCQTIRCSRPAPGGASPATPSSAASRPTSRPPHSAAHHSRRSAFIRTCSGTAARCRCCRRASTAPSSPSGSGMPTPAPPSNTSTPT